MHSCPVLLPQPALAPPPGSSVREQIEYYLAIIRLYAPLINPSAALHSSSPTPPSPFSPSDAPSTFPSSSSPSFFVLSDRELRRLSALLAPTPRPPSPLRALPSVSAASSSGDCSQPSTSLAYIAALPALPACRYSRVCGEECAICQEPLISEEQMQSAAVAAAATRPSSPPSSPSSPLTGASPASSPPRPRSASPAASVLVLPCHHLFHSGCVVRWLLTRNTCPCCRYQLPTDSPLYNRHVVERQPPPLQRTFSPAAQRRFVAPPLPATVPRAKRPREGDGDDGCALSAEGVDCVLLPEGLGVPGAAVHERLTCGHRFHRQCLVTAGQLMGRDTEVKLKARADPREWTRRTQQRRCEGQSAAASSRPGVVFCPVCCAFTEHAE